MAVHWGTSSWSNKGWLGPFYPKGTKPGDWLRYYAEQFDTVEADVTYYRLPDERLVSEWARKVGDGFRLAAKFPKTIVHCGEGPGPDPKRILVPEHVDRETEAFLHGMGYMGAACGPLLLQFPFFNRRVFASSEPFLERLDAFLARLPETFRYAVEVRNKDWIDDALLSVLRRHRAALALVDIVYMPPPWFLAREHDLVTTDFTYSRLIGDRKLVDARTKTFDSIVVDQSSRLERWTEFLRGMHESVPESYVYANNHYAGHGPATIRELRERFGAVSGA